MIATYKMISRWKDNWGCEFHVSLPAPGIYKLNWILREDGQCLKEESVVVKVGSIEYQSFTDIHYTAVSYVRDYNDSVQVVPYNVHMALLQIHWTHISDEKTYTHSLL